MGINTIWKSFRNFVTSLNTDSIIESDVRRRHSVIYGRRAMNKQLTGYLNAPTSDYDIYTRRPHINANFIEHKLDRKAGYDLFYTKPALHKGTFRVINKGPDLKQDTEDDYVIADYTQIPVGLKTVRINGIRYESLQSITKNKRKILKDPESEYRHEKDRLDLERIRANKRIRRY